MAREIKFRAWDTRAFFKPDIPCMRNMEYIYSFFEQGGTFSGDINEDDGMLIFMQFTGLKDKNGKEIYEGDRLKSEFGHIGIVHFGKCCYSIQGFNIEWDDGDITGFEDAAHCDIEVIGNIYENPELIK